MELQLSRDGASVWQPADQAWRPLWLRQEDVRVVATELGIGSATPVMLAGGLLNQTWLLRSTPDHWVVRIGRSGRTTAQVRYEADLLQAWHSTIPAVVPISHIVCDDVLTGGRVVSVFPFRDGVDGTTMSGATRAQQMAPVLAAMHRISLGLQLGDRPGVPPVWSAPVAPLWKQVSTALSSSFAARDLHLLEKAVSTAVDQLDRQIENWHTAGRLVDGIPVHADLNARNQIYRQGRLVGIIDADDCRADSLVAEVASLAYSDPHAIDPHQVWQWYVAAGGPLPSDSEELLLPLAQHAVLGELRWCLSDDGQAHPNALGTLNDIVHDLTLPVRG